jgi:hypothetical protein
VADQSVARPLPAWKNTVVEETPTGNHASSWIRTHNPSVWSGEDISCVRPRDHCCVWNLLWQLIEDRSGCWGKIFVRPSLITFRIHILPCCNVWFDVRILDWWLLHFFVTLVLVLQPCGPLVIVTSDCVLEVHDSILLPEFVYLHWTFALSSSEPPENGLLIP